MMQGPTREEFERMYQTLTDGFKGVHLRLDVLNGRTGKAEIADAELRVRVTSLEKELFHSPRRRDSDVPKDRKQERALLAFGIAVLGILTKLAFLAGDVVIDALKAAFKVAH